MPNSQQTIYERVGGEKAIHDMIREFYNRVLADAELSPFFKINTYAEEITGSVGAAG